MTSLLVVALVAASPWSTQRTLAFGDGDSWRLVEPRTETVRDLDLPAPFQASQLISSKDGSLIVFVSLGDGPRESVYLWRPQSSDTPKRLSSLGAYAADIALSQDEKKVYFSSSNSGAPGQHVGKDWGQIFTANLDGDEVHQVTSGEGCHTLPIPAGMLLFFIHTSCRGDYWLESLTQPQVRLGEILPYRELAASPDGKEIVASTLIEQVYTLLRISTASPNKPTVISTILATTPKLRPQFGRNRDEIIIQDHQNILVVKGGKQTVLSTLKRGQK